MDEKESDENRSTFAASFKEVTPSPDLVVSDRNSPSPSHPGSARGREELRFIDAVDEYELLALIGEGGMGSVYKAKHKQLGKGVAVKIIRPELVSNETAVRRFEQEAKASRDLTHANSVAVYDFGQTKVGAPYLVMDLLNGKSLADIIKEEGFLDVPPIATCVRLISKAQRYR